MNALIDSGSIIQENLCIDVILGLEFQNLHDKVVFNFGGEQPLVKVCSLAALKVQPADLFADLSNDCQPIIAAKSMR